MLIVQFNSASELVKHAMLEWESDNARSEAWFTKAAVVFTDDPTAFCRAVLKFVTEIFDHTGKCNCMVQVWSEANIQEIYLPGLLETQDRFERVAEAYAKRVIAGDELRGFMTAVRVELNSRLHHWHAEALTYYRQREFALAAMNQPDKTHSDAIVQQSGEKASGASRHNPVGAQERQAVIMPILLSKKWTRNKWASKAGVSKSCVYDYLDGRRQLSKANRQALAEELGIAVDKLPE